MSYEEEYSHEKDINSVRSFREQNVGQRIATNRYICFTLFVIQLRRTSSR